MKNDEAQLIFLNSIEENTVKTAEAIGLLIEKHESLIKEIGEQTKQLLPKPFPAFPVQKPVDLTTVSESVQSLHNVIVMSTNKISTELSKVAQGYDRVVDELKRIERPRKWKMEIDRNFKTREVQGVVMVAVD